MRTMVGDVCDLLGRYRYAKMVGRRLAGDLFCTSRFTTIDVPNTSRPKRGWVVGLPIDGSGEVQVDVETRLC